MTPNRIGARTGHVASVDDPHYTIPLYQKAEAARIIRIPRGTLRDWANPASGLVTTASPVTPRGPTVPFVGLTEAYVLAAFRSAGVPMQRIRPAIRVLEEQIGLRQALASERLKTDGAEVLWDYGQLTDDPAEKDAVGDLVVVRNGQGVFKAVVANYLRRVTYREGWARVINVGAGKVDVTVDPLVNGGRPTLASRGIAAADVLSRIRAGETSRAVAADYGLRLAEVTALLELAA
jgi:uncharacterized protein (DUF433 family)